MKFYLGWTKAQWVVVLKWWYQQEGQYLDADLLTATINDPEVYYTAQRIKKEWLAARKPLFFNPELVERVA